MAKTLLSASGLRPTPFLCILPPSVVITHGGTAWRRVMHNVEEVLDLMRTRHAAIINRWLVFCSSDPTHFTIHSAIRNALFLFLCALLSPKSLVAQASKTAGWFFLSHSQKLVKKWRYMTDAQLRSSPGLVSFQNVLLRLGWLYHVADKQSVGIGYTYFATWKPLKYFLF